MWLVWRMTLDFFAAFFAGSMSLLPIFALVRKAA
jgi:hypothetical protein